MTFWDRSKYQLYSWIPHAVKFTGGTLLGSAIAQEDMMTRFWLISSGTFLVCLEPFWLVNYFTLKRLYMRAYPRPPTLTPHDLTPPAGEIFNHEPAGVPAHVEEDVVAKLE